MFKRGLILGLVLLLAVSVVLGINAGKSYINTNYNTGELLSGQINLSFDNDLASGRLDAVSQGMMVTLRRVFLNKLLSRCLTRMQLNIRAIQVIVLMITACLMLHQTRAL